MKVTATVSFPIHVELELPDGTSKKDRDAALIKEAAEWLQWAKPWETTLHKSIVPVITIEKSEKGFAASYRGGPDEPPKVGDIIYIGTQMYIDHGEDDIAGGRARVEAVKEVMHGTRKKYGVQLKGFAGHTWYWDHLSGKQEEYAERYDNDWAKPDPDYG